MHIHFIAIGGSVMHGLAIALKKAGHEVTGSDDQIYGAAREKLEAQGLLPDAEGWDADRIADSVEAVVLGMHAAEDNPELARAQSLGKKIYSFPALIFELSKNKQRIVIAGSYGKSSITAMIMHVLEGCDRKFNYLVGAEVPGFENSVRLDKDNPVIIIEGDEYLTSRLDPEPKFLRYHAHMVVISGIAWDHVNVYPTEESYVLQFDRLIRSMDKAGVIVYNEADKRLRNMVEAGTESELHFLHPYKAFKSKLRGDKYLARIGVQWQETRIFGKHNMSNLAAAWEVCELLSIEPADFRKHIATFTGAHQRLEIVSRGEPVIIRDYAHAPDKARASVSATREMYPHKNIIACFELHTFSSLEKSFLGHYKKALKEADDKVIFIDPAVIEKKGFSKEFSDAELEEAFGEKVIVARTVDELEAQVNNLKSGEDVLLMMSSGNFAGWRVFN